MAKLSEVAELAGVHVSTASRVLRSRDCDMVSDATRQRVLEAAERLRYKPSAAARALVSGRSDSVAVIVHYVADPHHMLAMAMLDRLTQDAGYSLQLTTSDDDVHDWLSTRRADIVMAVSTVDNADRFISSIASPHQLVLAVGPLSQTLPRKALCAYWEDRAGLGLAVSHLAELGHEHIAFLAGGPVEHPKQRAFEAAVEEQGLSHTLIIQCGDESDQLAAGAAMARDALGLQPRPSALIARNDEFACGALHGLWAEGVRVPEEMSLVGYSGIPMTAYTCPPITTVCTPLLDCIETLLLAGLQRLADEEPAQEPEHVAIRFEPSLAVRASTAPPEKATK